MINVALYSEYVFWMSMRSIYVWSPTIVFGIYESSTLIGLDSMNEQADGRLIKK